MTTPALSARIVAQTYLASTLADTSETVDLATVDGLLDVDKLLEDMATHLPSVPLEVAIDILTSERQDSRALRLLWAQSVELTVRRDADGSIPGAERFDLARLCPHCGRSNQGVRNRSTFADMHGRRICRTCIPPAAPDPVESLHPRCTPGLDQVERMTALCQTVPYLVDKPGFGLGWDTDIVFPMDDEGDTMPDEFPMPWDWCHSSAATEAVRFVRHVWNRCHPSPCLAYWDDQHRAAYLAWAVRPWWC